MISPLVLGVLAFASVATSFPSYGSLAGLTEAELEAIIPTLHIRDVPPPPGPLKFNGTKLVNDKDHPYMPLQPGDMRGPCPGLNTLASHGYIPRNGIATPTQIINAVQEGFNMGNDIATFVTFSAFIVDGNPLTNLLSIGAKTPLTGTDPPQPAVVGGLDTHALFEGDASMTREDAFLGDNHSFNETLFDQFTNFSAQFGGGNYNLSAAAELRFTRIQESIAENPQFSFVAPRIFTAFAESIFPLVFFVDGRAGNEELSMSAARGFFQNMMMPDGFHRANHPFTLTDIRDMISVIFAVHPVQPGANQGNVTNNYVPDPTSANLTEFCLIYTNFVNNTVRSLYPNPTGVLLNALNANLDNFFIPVKGQGCTQFFPWGKPE